MAEKKLNIKKAIKKPGALKEQLGISKDKKIPEDVLDKAAKAPGKLGQRARFAKTLKGNEEVMDVEIDRTPVRDFLVSVPKTSVATVVGAILVYCQAKGYIGNDEAILASTVMAAMGITINIITRR